MTRLRKVTMKPLRKRQAWLPLATHAVAAGLNSPTAKQILALSRKSKGSEVNRHSVPWSIPCPDAAAYYPLAAASGGDFRYLEKRKLPAERVSRACETLPVHGPTTVKKFEIDGPKLPAFTSRPGSFSL